MEDKLQDGVPETIQALREAGIKVGNRRGQIGKGGRENFFIQRLLDGVPRIFTKLYNKWISLQISKLYPS